MTIRAKTLGINSFALICVLAIIYLVASPLILHGFENVEAKDLQQKVQQAHDAITVQQNSLSSKLEDWSNWDDSYQLVTRQTPALLQADFGSSSHYDNPVFDIVLYINRAGQITYANGGSSTPSDLRTRLTANSSLLKYGTAETVDPDKDYVEGILGLHEGLLMVAARPIVKTDGSGPANGTIVFAKYLDKDVEQTIKDTTHLGVSFYQFNRTSLPSDIKTILPSLRDDAIKTKVIDKNTIAGYTYIDDISNHAVGMIKVQAGRPIYQQGKTSIRLFSLVMAGAGVIFAAFTALLLEWIVISRVSRLTRKVASIKDEKGLHTRLNFKGNDEVSTLATSINQMLSRLRSSTAEISSLNTALEHEKNDQERLVRQRTRQLEAEKSRFLASINSLPLGFILTDTNGTILMLNPSIKHILNLRDDDPASVAEQVESKDSILHKLLELTQKTASHKKIKSTELTTKEGRFLHAMIAPVVTRGGEIDGVVILLEDVTEARILDRSKDEFFSIASHELRTPLTAIRGNTSMIKQFYQKQLKDQTLDSMVTDIYSSSVRLIEIVNDFLDASSLEQGKMKFSLEEFALDEVIEKVVYEMGGVVNERKLYLKVDKTLGELPHVYGDPNRTKQVIYNLIGNALKFTDKGGVTLNAVADANHMIKVTVTDTGRGISPEGQQLLFHKFQQAASSIHTRDTTRGTGLGLYISKLIVEHQGGVIQIENSQEGVGTTFSFTIPIHNRQHDKPANNL